MITRLYRVWSTMRQRCYNKRDFKYHNYGGRGIKVCDEWSSYIPFKEWALTNGYSQGLILDRIDNNGNYLPENCRWVDYKISNNNRRDNHRYNIDGENLTAAELGRKHGISDKTIRTRLSRGWSITEAIGR